MLPSALALSLARTTPPCCSWAHKKPAVLVLQPYRGFLRRLFVENSPAGAAFKGLAWLFLGVSTSDSLLYDDDWQVKTLK